MIMIFPSQIFCAGSIRPFRVSYRLKMKIGFFCKTPPDNRYRTKRQLNLIPACASQWKASASGQAVLYKSAISVLVCSPTVIVSTISSPLRIRRRIKLMFTRSGSVKPSREPRTFPSPAWLLHRAELHALCRKNQPPCYAVDQNDAGACRQLRTRIFHTDNFFCSPAEWPSA